MPGRMGGKITTIRNLKIFSIVPETNYVIVRGAVPGKPGAWVKIRDNWLFKFPHVPPFPTHVAEEGQEPPKELLATFDNPWSEFDSSITSPDQLKEVKEEYRKEIEVFTEEMRQVLIKEAAIIRKSARGTTELKPRTITSLVKGK